MKITVTETITSPRGWDINAGQESSTTVHGEFPATNAGLRKAVSLSYELYDEAKRLGVGMAGSYIHARTAIRIDGVALDPWLDEAGMWDEILAKKNA